MSHSVGVIVGRFQVHELHQEHERLILDVMSKHDKVIIFLGLSEAKATQENPLDFEARKQMLLAKFPKLNVLYIKDSPSDDVWSKMLDEKIADLLSPSQKPMLYGGRDSFIGHYTGRFDTEELEPQTYVKFSGSDVRRSIASASTKASPDFRAGVVWATHGRYPTCYPTVDVVVFKDNQMLLAKKEHENRWCIIGGFAEPESPTFEADARSEVKEKTGIEITDPMYVGSFKINDWRYRNEKDKIKALLFTAEHMYGAPDPKDDIAELKWFDIPSSVGGGVALLEGFMAKNVMPHHQPLLAQALWRRRG